MDNIRTNGYPSGGPWRQLRWSTDEPKDVVRFEGMLQSPLSKQDQPGEHFLFDGSSPAFGVGIEIERPWRERHARDACLVNRMLTGRTVRAVSIMDEILALDQEAPVRHGHVAHDLDHPPLVRMWGHIGHVHLPAGEVDKK